MRDDGIRRGLWGIAAAGLILSLTAAGASAETARCKTLGTVVDAAESRVTQFATHSPGHRYIEPLPLQGAMTKARNALERWVLDTTEPVLPKNVSSALKSVTYRALAMPPVLVRNAAQRTDATLLAAGLGLAQQIRSGYAFLCPKPTD